MILLTQWFCHCFILWNGSVFFKMWMLGVGSWVWSSAQIPRVAMSVQPVYCGLEQCFLKIFEICSLEVVCFFFPHIIFSPVLVCDLCTWKELFCFWGFLSHTEATSSFKHWKRACFKRWNCVVTTCKPTWQRTNFKHLGSFLPAA